MSDLLKKNTEGDYTLVTSTRSITVDLWKAIGIFASAILTAIIGTAFAVGSTLNSDHFILVNAVERIDQLEANAVRADVYGVQQQRIEEQLAELKKLLDRIENKI